MKQFKFFNSLQFPKPSFNCSCYSCNNYTLSVVQVTCQGLCRIPYYQSPKFLSNNLLICYWTACIIYHSSSAWRNIFPWWQKPSLVLTVVCRGEHFLAIKLDDADQLVIVSCPVEGVRVPVA